VWRMIWLRLVAGCCQLSSRVSLAGKVEDCPVQYLCRCESREL